MAKNEKFNPPSKDNLEEIKKMWEISYKDLVKPTNSSDSSTQKNRSINYDQLRMFVMEHAESLDDAEGIMELLPDLELVRETLVANISSPKDLMNFEASIQVDKLAPPEFASIVFEHFKTVFNLEENIPKILEEALFSKGSYSLFCIPPKVISDIIQTNTISFEDIYSSPLLINPITVKLPKLGFIKSSSPISYMMEELSLEITKSITKNTKEFPSKELVEITDNIGYLAFPSLSKTARQNDLKSKAKLYYGIEELINTDKIDKVYKNKTANNIPLLDVTFDEKLESQEFNPIVLKLPPEAVIPICLSGEPDKHVGYYVFLDENGHPLHYSKSSNKFKQLNDKLNQSVNQHSEMVRVGLGVSYPATSSNMSKIDEALFRQKLLMDEYNRVFERNLLEAIQSSSNKESFEIANPTELYRIVFARQLAKQYTRVLYIPAELLTYVAFNYTPEGMGISLLEKSKLYASFRAILMFATVIAGINSSVNKKTLTVTLDNDDPDQLGTVEEVINEYTALQASGSTPIGRLNPLDIVDFLQKSGVQLKINGGDRWPGTELDVAESKQEITPPNTDVMEMLKDAQYAALWTSRDTIEHTADLEFAATITSANLLQAKRATKCQKILIEKISQFIQQYIYCKGPLYNELYKKYQETKTDHGLSFKDCVKSIRLLLPKPDMSVIETQLKDYNSFNDFVEAVFNSYISDDMMGNLESSENITNNLGAIKTAITSVLKRNFLRSNNMLPELDQLLTAEDSNLEELIEQHHESIIRLSENVLRYVRKVEHKEEEKTTEVLDKLNPPEEESTEESSDIGEETDNTEDTGNEEGETIDEDMGDLGDMDNLEEEGTTKETEPSEEEPTTEKEENPPEEETDNTEEETNKEKK